MIKKAEPVSKSKNYRKDAKTLKKRKDFATLAP
jgi:hypothetical protein